MYAINRTNFIYVCGKRKKTRRLIRNEIRDIELPEYVHTSIKYTLSLNALDTGALILKRKHRYVPRIYSDSVSLSKENRFR